MQSKWKKLKERTLTLRKQGVSMNEIERILGVARSTQSNWFKGLELGEEASKLLWNKKRLHLNEARKKAVVWHNRQKEQRMLVASKGAERTLSNINHKDANLLELSLAMLYLGEGAKRTSELSMGNSNPIILRFFINSICSLYGLNINTMRFDLHLRADQDQEEIKNYWVNELNIPVSRFATISFDKRTLGRPTYPEYKGVCVVNCGNVAIQRKLVYLGNAYCEKIKRA